MWYGSEGFTSPGLQEHRPPMRRGSQLGLTKTVTEEDLSCTGPNAGCLSDEVGPARTVCGVRPF